jgi:hypothetical protein
MSCVSSASEKSPTKTNMIYDKRASLQIRIAINRILGNKNSFNTMIAHIISEFSHSTIIQKASMFQSGCPPQYLCVAQVHSPFWVTCLPMPGRIDFYQTEATANTNFGHLHWTPDWLRTGLYKKKRLFDPFGEPFIKCRNHHFLLK